MGIPKFYRWISERYPCLSEVVRDYQIPEFDNLYLDMNGIIHVCSHPNDDDPFFRITEEKIFKDIFHYIEVLFRIVKPRKVFFMAVDGVAPRAKMNQQRGRRFRSAKEAATNEAKAIANGKELPKEERFDSNCITPGTGFMDRLDRQLRYFVASKISNDKLWQGLRVYLSGHETPGEGEHKIMDFIRYEKSREDYDANTRHCLYGLDADLIMLGLCSHEPHFALLREEVKFTNPKNKKSGGGRTAVPEETVFHLLHLSLMREYLDMEFSSLKESLPFEYNVESIIDDWILMGFLVGNDFIPHLPDLHIKHEALPKLWKLYMDILPEMDGYINEGGDLNLRRFQMYMNGLSTLEYKLFTDKYLDLKYLESKTGKRRQQSGSDENDVVGLEAFEQLGCDEQSEAPTFSFQNMDKKRIEKLKSSLREEEEDPEFDAGFLTDPDFLKTFRDYKNRYYAEKLKCGEVTPQLLREQAVGYVRAIQWNLHYYYHGVPSWSWFFPHHYSPYISDVTDFAGLDIKFDLSTPFLPFQQLLAVLPPASKSHVPPSYHWLMEDEKSPIIDFYPADFATDLNGKSQDWEAVVLIPFIDEEKLLKAMAQCESKLEPEEVKRNKHSPAYLFTYSSDDLGVYEAPAHFPAIEANHAKLDLVNPADWYVPRNRLVKGICKNVRLDVYFPGFPTFKHLEYTFNLERAQVRVFQSNSRSDNMMLSLKAVSVGDRRKQLARSLIGSTVHVNWPHMTEALVKSVSMANSRYAAARDGSCVVEMPSNERNMAAWDAKVSAIEDRYQNKLGIKVGTTEVLVHARPVVGRIYIADSLGRVKLQKVYAEKDEDFALQSVVRELVVQEPTFKKIKNIQELFPVGSPCFPLTSDYYGRLAIVTGYETGPKHVKVKIKVPNYQEEANPGIAKICERNVNEEQYFQSFQIGQQVGLPSHVVSRITGTVLLTISDDSSPAGAIGKWEGKGNGNAGDNRNGPKLNIGLNLKLSKKNTEAVGYTRRSKEGGWLYSASTAQALAQYVEEWPEVIDHISRAMGNDVYSDVDVFKTDTANKVAALKEWLEALPCAKADRQTCGAPVVPLPVIKSLDVSVRKWKASLQDGKQKSVRITTKPHLLFKPNEGQGSMLPDPGTKFSLYDRVANVRDSFTVPLGERGYIIGIIPGLKEEDTLYEVMFDNPFPAGLSGERFCGDERGYRMHGNSLLSITYGLEKWRAQSSGVTASANGSVASQDSQDQRPNAWQGQLKILKPASQERQAPPASAVPRFKEQARPVAASAAAGSDSVMNDRPSRLASAAASSFSSSAAANHRPPLLPDPEVVTRRFGRPLYDPRPDNDLGSAAAAAQSGYSRNWPWPSSAPPSAPAPTPPLLPGYPGQQPAPSPYAHHHVGAVQNPRTPQHPHRVGGQSWDATPQRPAARGGQFYVPPAARSDPAYDFTYGGASRTEWAPPQHRSQPQPEAQAAPQRYDAYGGPNYEYQSPYVQQSQSQWGQSYWPEVSYLSPQQVANFAQNYHNYTQQFMQQYHQGAQAAQAAHYAAASQANYQRSQGPAEFFGYYQEVAQQGNFDQGYQNGAQGYQNGAQGYQNGALGYQNGAQGTGLADDGGGGGPGYPNTAYDHLQNYPPSPSQYPHGGHLGPGS